MQIKITVRKDKKAPSPKAEVYSKEWMAGDEEGFFKKLAEALLGVKKEEKDGEKV